VAAALSLVVACSGDAGATGQVPDPGPCPAVDIAPVDPDATPAARCAAGRLDEWRRMGVMAIGQQLEVQEPTRMRQPLESLAPLTVPVVGFDFAELLNAQAYFEHDPVPFLADLFRSGTVLTASWHADNPGTDGNYADRGWTDLRQLLDPATPAAIAFWGDYDKVLGQAARLQEAGAAVLFRPLHEASGGWFWWGHPDAGVYRALYAAMQDRAAAAGVHNLLWGYAANPRVYSHDLDPLPLVPARIDLGGIDIYDEIIEQPRNRITITDYRRLAAVVPRMALTETGPYQSTTGFWNPRAITDTLRGDRLYATYAMLWRDDPSPGFIYQVSSLSGGPAWLASCPGGLCRLRP
jgi:hypothetical protein